jgi:hypothetical protein
VVLYDLFIDKSSTSHREAIDSDTQKLPRQQERSSFRVVIFFLGNVHDYLVLVVAALWPRLRFEPRLSSTSTDDHAQAWRSVLKPASKGSCANVRQLEGEKTERGDRHTHLDS